MRSNLPRFVERTRAKGHIYLYFRRHGQRWRLPGAPGDSEFSQRYLELLEQTNGDGSLRRFAAHSVGALRAEYKASDEFLGLSAQTRTSYAKMLDLLLPIDHFAAKDIRRKHIRRLRSKLAGKGRTQHLFVQVVSALFSFGMQEQDYDVEVNPAARFRRVGEVKSYRAWTDDQCEAFETSEPPSHLLTAYYLGRYTGQRRGDVLRMLRRAYNARSNTIEVKQSKGGEELTIPVHSRLKAHLDTITNDALLYVVDERGRSFGQREEAFSKEFRAALNRAGLCDLHYHGLRHTAATALADAGCPAHYIMSITGHRTLAMVQRYTKRADQKRNARAAMAMIDRTGTERETAKPEW